MNAQLASQGREASEEHEAQLKVQEDKLDDSIRDMKM